VRSLAARPAVADIVLQAGATTSLFNDIRSGGQAVNDVFAAIPKLSPRPPLLPRKGPNAARKPRAHLLLSWLTGYAKDQGVSSGRLFHAAGRMGTSSLGAGAEQGMGGTSIRNWAGRSCYGRGLFPSILGGRRAVNDQGYAGMVEQIERVLKSHQRSFYTYSRRRSCRGCFGDL